MIVLSGVIRIFGVDPKVSAGVGSAGPSAVAPVRPAGLALPGHVAVATVVVLELIRATGPLLDSVYAERGLEAAISTALVTYLAPSAVVVLALGVARLSRPGVPLMLLVSTVALAALRLAAQAGPDGSRIALGLAAAAAAIAVLVLATFLLVERSGSGRLGAASVGTGAATGIALQLALGTWDAYWRDSAIGWGVSLAVVGTLLVLAVEAVRDRPATHVARARRLWALGPFLALSTVVTGSLPFAASQSGTPTLLAGPVAAVGLLAAGALRLRRRSPPPGSVPSTVSALALPIAVLAVLRLPAEPISGVLVLGALVAAQVASVAALGSALEPSGHQPAHGTVGLRAAIASSAVGLGAIVPVMLYQVDYSTPLGFPNALVLVAAASQLAVGGSLGRRGPRMPPPVALGPMVPVAASAVVLAVTVTLLTSALRPVKGLDSATPTEDGSVRVMVWNVHYGVSADGALELDAIADAVERQAPDVVLLNEVSRGWLIGGGTDMRTWLADQLGGHHAFAPAADRQFGNMVISRWPLRDVEVHLLPYGQGPQTRSALSATISTGAGDLTVVAAHLQQYRSSQPTRIEQLGVLLPRLAAPGVPAMVVGGDFNARPGEPEIAMMTDAGFVSAVDQVGDKRAMTVPSTAPTARYDWLFGRGVRFTRAEVLTEELASDHLPVLANLAPRIPR